MARRSWLRNEFGGYGLGGGCDRPRRSRCPTDPRPRRAPSKERQVDASRRHAHAIGHSRRRQDRQLDWYTYSGFRRYHSECHVCHGPDGEGSSYAPALVNSLKTMTTAISCGSSPAGSVRDEAGTEFVMPALGDNKNVMCFIDDLYYISRRASDRAAPRSLGRAAIDKPEQAGR